VIPQKWGILKKYMKIFFVDIKTGDNEPVKNVTGKYYL
jgi:pyruvate-formate lyase-activating enzyme